MIAGLLIVSLYVCVFQIFSVVDEYAPGFSDSVLGYEVLPPPDLEEIFGLTGGVSDLVLVPLHLLPSSPCSSCLVSFSALKYYRNFYPYVRVMI